MILSEGFKKNLMLMEKRIMWYEKF
jgi:hypothetical protein